MWIVDKRALRATSVQRVVNEEWGIRCTHYEERMEKKGFVIGGEFSFTFFVSLMHRSLGLFFFFFFKFYYFPLYIYFSFCADWEDIGSTLQKDNFSYILDNDPWRMKSPNIQKYVRTYIHGVKLGTFESYPLKKCQDVANKIFSITQPVLDNV